MKAISYLLFLGLSLSFLSSCVTTKKYEQLEQSLVKSETELIRRRTQVNNLKRDTLTKGANIRQLQADVKALENYNEYTQSQLFKRLNTLQENLDEKEEELFLKEKILREQESTLKEKEQELTEKSANLNQIVTTIKSQNQLVYDLRLLVAEALSGFDESSTEVTIQESSVYISVSEQLLFSSGSTKLKSDGELAIQKLANVISRNPSFKVIVEGHTDNKPTNGKQDNWDLSVLRATEVTRILVKGGMNPMNVIPSGRAQFKPIADNVTTEGQAKNRRINIILTPDMSRMYELLKKY